jgi:hypothetical protein
MNAVVALMPVASSLLMVVHSFWGGPAPSFDLADGRAEPDLRRKRRSSTADERKFGIRV